MHQQPLHQQPLYTTNGHSEHFEAQLQRFVGKQAYEREPLSEKWIGSVVESIAINGDMIKIDLVVNQDQSGGGLTPGMPYSFTTPRDHTGLTEQCGMLQLDSLSGSLLLTPSDAGDYTLHPEHRWEALRRSSFSGTAEKVKKIAATALTLVLAGDSHAVELENLVLSSPNSVSRPTDTDLEAARRIDEILQRLRLDEDSPVESDSNTMEPGPVERLKSRKNN